MALFSLRLALSAFLASGSCTSHAALGPNLSLLISITLWRFGPAHQVQVHCEFKTQTQASRPPTWAHCHLLRKQWFNHRSQLLHTLSVHSQRSHPSYKPSCIPHTQQVWYSLCAYLLPLAWFPGPPGSWLSPPPPGRAFQTRYQPWWTTLLHSNTPSTVSEADWEISLSLPPYLSLPLPSSCQRGSFALSSLFTCSWHECV